MGIDYEFKNKELLKLALTHISYANERLVPSNQRLEFLGDSILSFIVSTHIYENNKDLNEGGLTEYRALVVCEKSLARAAKNMDIGNMLIMGNSEKLTGGKDKPSILADAFEAVLGAIYLDGGIDVAREWALLHLKESIENPSGVKVLNFKSELQNLLQKSDKGRDFVKYELVSRTGPDHEPIFNVEAAYKGKVIGVGSGSSRKDAEQEAAEKAYYSVLKSK